jgi:hypothetical protein
MNANPDTTTLAEAKVWLGGACREKGIAECPVCSQAAKIWKYQIVASAASGLVSFATKFGDGEYYHVEKCGLSGLGGNWGRLRFWGLLEQKPKSADDKEKKHSGYWKITERGLNFAMGRISVPRYILMYDEKFLGFEGMPVSIVECLGNKFDYQEILKQ